MSERSHIVHINRSSIFKLGLNWNIFTWFTVKNTSLFNSYWHFGQLLNSNRPSLKRSLPRRPLCSDWSALYPSADICQMQRLCLWTIKQTIVLGFHYFFPWNVNFSNTSIHVGAKIFSEIYEFKTQTTQDQINNQSYRTDTRLWAHMISWPQLFRKVGKPSKQSVQSRLKICRKKWEHYVNLSFPPPHHV